MHGHQHTYTEIYIYMHAYAYMSSYIKTSPPIITSTTDKGENDIRSFIQSGYLYSASLSPLLLRGAPTTVIDSVGVYTTKHYRQPHTVYTVYNQCSNCRGLGVQPPPHLADPLPQVKIRPRGVGFQPTHLGFAEVGMLLDSQLILIRQFLKYSTA